MSNYPTGRRLLDKEKQKIEGNSAVSQPESQNAIRIRKRSKGLNHVDFLVFLIPCLQFIHVTLIGTLTGSDLLLLATLLYLVFRKKIQVTAPACKWLAALCTLWLISQCVTDIVRHTAFMDYARGWSNIGLTLVNFTVLCSLLYGRPRRLVFYGWGLVAGGLLTYFINPDEFMRDYPWKFGVSYPVTLGVILLASNEEMRGRLPLVMAAIIGAVNIYMGSRNQGGACLAAAFYLLITRFLRQSSKAGVRLRPRTLATIAASITLGALGVLWAYQYTASAGILGEEQGRSMKMSHPGNTAYFLADVRKCWGRFLPSMIRPF